MIYLVQAIRLLLVQVGWRVGVSWRPSPRLRGLLLSFWIWLAALIILGLYTATLAEEQAAQADVAATALGIVGIVAIALLACKIVGWVSRSLRPTRQPPGCDDSTEQTRPCSFVGRCRRALTTLRRR